MTALENINIRNPSITKFKQIFDHMDHHALLYTKQSSDTFTTSMYMWINEIKAAS